MHEVDQGENDEGDEYEAEQYDEGYATEDEVGSQSEDDAGDDDADWPAELINAVRIQGIHDPSKETAKRSREGPRILQEDKWRWRQSRSDQEAQGAASLRRLWSTGSLEG